MDAGIAKQLDVAVDQAMTAASIPGAIMKADFYSRIGSLTKTFTVTGPQGDKITQRQLASMRSGLENYAKMPEFQQAIVADPYRSFTPQELLGYAFTAPMPFPPGAAYEYSNTNTVLLGLVVEKLKRTSRAARPGLYRHDCRPAMQAQRLQTMGIPGQPPGDGYGLGIFNLGGWIGHNGSVPGYEAVTVYLPENQMTLVILINTDIHYQDSEPSAILATAITKVITPEHVYTIGES